MSRLWVWGAGELGGRVAKKAVESGGTAVGLTLTKKRHKALRRLGVDPRRGAPEALTPRGARRGAPGTRRAAPGGAGSLHRASVCVNEALTRR